MREAAPPAPGVVWTPVQDLALVQYLGRLRVLASEDGDLRVYAGPAPAGAGRGSRELAAAEQVHVLVTRDDTGGMFFPTIRHYVLAPLLRPELHALASEGGVTRFELRHSDARGRPRTAQVEVGADSFDIWGVRFEERTGQPDILELLVDRTPAWIPCDDEEYDEDHPPEGALVVRVFDLQERAFMRWVGGMWRYIPVLHVVAAHGTGAQRVERVIRAPAMDSVLVRELRRRADGSFVLDVELRPFDPDHPFLSRLPQHRSQLVIDESGFRVEALR